MRLHIFWTLQTCKILHLAILFADTLCTYAMKNHIDRIRPCHNFSELRKPDGCGGLASFPSNHAANISTFAIFTALVFGVNPMVSFLLILAFSVGFSRIYLAAHFPSDVLAGFFIGAVIALSCRYIYKELNLLPEPLD